MKVSREAYYKRDALRIKRWMEWAGFRTVRITGKRTNWLVSTNGAVGDLAKFAGREAHYESKR